MAYAGRNTTSVAMIIESRIGPVAVAPIKMPSQIYEKLLTVGPAIVHRK